MWATQSRDAKASARYGNAVNSAFELGADEVGRYGLLGIQHFFFVRAPDGTRAVFMAAVNLFASLGTDALTGLPLVDSSSISQRYILARHLNHRVIMPFVGATHSQLSHLAKLRTGVSSTEKKMGDVRLPAAIARHMEKGDALRRELVALEGELRLATSVHLLVLGARCSDVEAVVPE